MLPVVGNRLHASYNDIKTVSEHIRSMFEQSNLKWNIGIHNKSMATVKATLSRGLALDLYSRHQFTLTTPPGSAQQAQSSIPHPTPRQLSSNPRATPGPRVQPSIPHTNTREQAPSLHRVTAPGEDGPAQITSCTPGLQVYTPDCIHVSGLQDLESGCRHAHVLRTQT
jgi:hypothetical protein